ncbi:hypothetical protein HK099_005076 [Clydaea vesicula]|uniref:glutamate-5-semialdehyde dehydrogenase n=1 Tax=Clydaea vesicula TaxID=447962 RepID=A0AAD5TZF3_9FUNG|nr:hypothetical protein HK099_005076 [Clydaea vesicula]
MEKIAQRARLASNALQCATNDHKNSALRAIYDQLVKDRVAILAENEKDLIANKDTLSQAIFNRLSLEKKFDEMLLGVLDVIKLDDPTAKCSLARKLDENLELYRVSCPVGVLLIIFEARPEVVVQISCLAIKSGNAVILKGGKEAHNSNVALFGTIYKALSSLDTSATSVIPPTSVNLVSSREDISTLLKLDKYIDLVIPRGSKSLVQHVQESTRIPVLGHADGICSVYVDELADAKKALSIVVDSKINYPAACNAAEKLLIHKKVAPTLLPLLATALFNKNVTLFADPEAFKLIEKNNLLKPALSDSFETEYLDLSLAVKVVDSLTEAVQHINEFGSHHTDSIVTEDKDRAEQFMKQVDSAGVFWNASTRFADGFRYGFGAEIGVSTNKTHARGPVGLEGIYGNGQAVGWYGKGGDENGKVFNFKHEDIPLEKVTKKFN